MLRVLILGLPKIFHLKIIKNNENKYIYILYTNKIKISLNCCNNNIYYDKKTHAIVAKSNKVKLPDSTRRQLLKIKRFFLFLICWEKFKISYTGKGYKVKKYKNLNFLDFTFGSCHFVKAYIKNYKLRYRRKKAIMVYYKIPFFLKKNFNKILNIKLINLYTQRGL